MKKIKQYKAIIIVTTLIFMFTGGFIAGNAYLQYQLEGTTYAMSQSNAATNITETDAAETQLEISYNLAEEILETLPDIPLLEENVIGPIYGDSSLETYMNDVNATSGAKDIIIQVCEDSGIAPDTAKVSDLTAEQICQIDMQVFQNSEHGK